MQSIFNRRNLFFMVLILLILAWMVVFIRVDFRKINFLEIHYTKYDALVKVLSTVIALLLIAIFAWLSKSTTKPAKPDLRTWLIGFLPTLFLGVSLVLVGNPDGRFPWGNAPYYLRVGGRTIKPRMFIELQKDHPFDIIVLGSSRAFTISTQTLDEKLDARSFNMSVEAASTIDLFGLTKFVTDHQAEPPKVLLVEIGHPTILNNSWKNGPLSIAQYLPAEKRVPITWDAIKSTVSLSGVTDSIYALAMLENQPPFITFEKSGYLIQAPVTDQQYKANLHAMKDIFRRLRCLSLDEDGIEYVERLVDFAQEERMSVVFYRSPLNNDFLRSINIKNPAYVTCDHLMRTYFDQLQETHDNVFFRDLAYYKPVINLHSEGFTDSWHLTSLSADLVVEALMPILEAALDRAQTSRQ